MVLAWASVVWKLIVQRMRVVGVANAGDGECVSCPIAVSQKWKHCKEER